MIYKSFILELYVNFSFSYLHCTLIVEIKNKIRTLFKSLLLKRTKTWWLMKTQGNDKLLYIKNCLLVITKNKKQLLKLTAAITYSLEKKFFPVSTFESL